MYLGGVFSLCIPIIDGSLDGNRVALLFITSYSSAICVSFSYTHLEGGGCTLSHEGQQKHSIIIYAGNCVKKIIYLYRANS